jgi:V/A-type H+/Na+-transporting ATPase subunit A
VIDFVILQQDAFDPVDRVTPMKRQKYMLERVLDVYETGFEFNSFEDVNPYFKRVINEFKQMNYSEYESDRFSKHEEELNKIIDEKKIA